MIERSPLFDFVTYATMILGMFLVLVPFWITIVAGSQNRRIRFPIGVPGPVRVRVSLSALVSTGAPPLVCRALKFRTRNVAIMNQREVAVGINLPPDRRIYFVNGGFVSSIQ